MPSFSRMSFRRNSSSKDKSNGESKPIAAAAAKVDEKPLPEKILAAPEVQSEKQNGHSQSTFVAATSPKTPGSLFLHDGTLLRTTIDTKGVGADSGASVASRVTFSHTSNEGQITAWTVRTSFTPPAAGFDDTLNIEPSTSDVSPSAAEYASLLSKPTAAAGTKPGAPRKEWQVSIEADAKHRSLLYAAENMGLLYSTSTSAARSEDEKFYILRKAFWQIPPHLFYNASGAGPSGYSAPHPLQFTLPNNFRYPVRSKPPPPGTVFYKRYIPSLHSFLSFRTASLETDIQLIGKWMNNPRVDAFWGEAGTEDHHREFLRKGLEDRHCFPVIGSWTDLSPSEGAEGGENVASTPAQEVPFGYFEIYWVKEDKLSGYTETGDWDRGVHVLVGEEKFRGYHRLEVWLSSLVHYMFLSDPRTQTLMLEPRVDNEKFISYLVRGGFYKEKEFAFPHKQAAVMKLKREAWDGPAS
ncbi:acetyltransferase [Peziza echinospora]|nr:acetyltransferase [Peziza echinospora]